MQTLINVKYSGYYTITWNQYIRLNYHDYNDTADDARANDSDLI